MVLPLQRWPPLQQEHHPPGKCNKCITHLSHCMPLLFHSYSRPWQTEVSLHAGIEIPWHAEGLCPRRNWWPAGGQSLNQWNLPLVHPCCLLVVVQPISSEAAVSSWPGSPADNGRQRLIMQQQTCNKLKSRLHSKGLVYVFIYNRHKFRIETIHGLPCTKLKSELSTANLWIVCLLAHAILDVVTCTLIERQPSWGLQCWTKNLPSTKVGSNVPRRSQARETKFFLPWAIPATDALCTCILV